MFQKKVLHKEFDLVLLFFPILFQANRDIFYIYTIRHFHILKNQIETFRVFFIHLPNVDLTGEFGPFVDEDDLLLVLILLRPGGI